MRAILRHPGRLAFLWAGVLLAAVGCTTQPSALTTPEQAANAETVAVSLTDAKHSRLLDFLAAQRGKVVVLDFWGEF